MKLRLLLFTSCLTFAADLPTWEYRLLGTAKTSTMEKEMNEAAQSGFEFMSVMGGETAFGGKQVVTVMGRKPDSPAQKAYKLLAANKTSTLEREMQSAADEGFEYKGQTVFESAFGGREVSVIMERDKAVPQRKSTYKLLATSKTSTMDKEMKDAGAQGFAVLGMTVAKTAFGGNEVICIMRQ